ncbi:MAG TPA: MFS transporter [Burkholderiaceae bacterium]|nr:MFS transporter [Burkholderiaceae bacterium]
MRRRACRYAAYRRARATLIRSSLFSIKRSTPNSASLLPFGAFFASYFAFNAAFTIYLPLWLAHRGFSAFQIGVLMSMQQVMRIVGPNVWGWVADHTSSRARVLRVTALASLLCFCAIFFGERFGVVLAVTVAINFFLAGQVPIAEALTVQRLGSNIGRYGRLRLWGSIGFIVSATLSGYCLDRLGIAWMPWIALLALGSTALVAHAVYDVAHAVTPKLQSASTRAQLAKPEVIAFFASCFLMIFSHASIYTYYSLFLERLGYSRTAIGLLLSFGVLIEVAVFWFQGRLLARVRVERLLLMTFVAASVRFMLIGTLADMLGWLLVAQALHALTFAAHHSASIVLIQRWFSGKLAARGQALYTSIAYGLGGSIGGLVAAWIWERIAASAVFLAAAVAAALGAGAVLVMMRFNRKC